MKTNVTLTAALLFATVFTASADDRKEVKNDLVHANFKAPAFYFGSPEDVDSAEMEKLKSMMLIKAPEFVWGEPGDADLSGLNDAENTSAKSQVKTVKYPAFVWGSPDDAGLAEINALKAISPAAK